MTERRVSRRQLLEHADRLRSFGTSPTGLLRVAGRRPVEAAVSARYRQRDPRHKWELVPTSSRHRRMEG